MKEVSSKDRTKFEAFLVERYEGEAEGAWPADMPKPWDSEECNKVHNIRKKLIVQAFCVGVLKTQYLAPGAEFKFLPNFCDVGEDIGRNAELLRFNFVENKGNLLMTYKSVIDHMRIWINQDERIRSWGLMTNCILVNACHYMMEEQGHIDVLIIETAKLFQDRYREKQKKVDKPKTEASHSGSMPSVS